MVKKLINILIGTYRNLIGYKTDEIERRRCICKECEHNEQFLNTRICNLCGCIIDSKTAVEEEKCLMNKW